jgi:hypothetical protein
MTSTGRRLRRYDHRLRDLVQRTGDVTIATDLGVPRSTARGWLGDGQTGVVSLDIANLKALELQQEVLELRRRVKKLTALLRLALLRTSEFTLTHERLPDGRGKIRILRAIDRARASVPLPAILRFVRLSPSRYGTRAYVHAVIDNFSRRILAWRVADTFATVNSVAVLVEASRTATPSATTPVVLADAGVENVNADVDDLIAAGVLRPLLAFTDLKFSNSMIEAWWRALHKNTTGSFSTHWTASRQSADSSRFMSRNTTGCFPIRRFADIRRTRCISTRCISTQAKRLQQTCWSTRPSRGSSAWR